jgi:hypothetical protein
MRRIGYCKLGRNMPLPQDAWGKVGGDDEPPLLLRTLAQRNPDVEWVLVGKNSGEDPQTIGMPPNVTNPWTELKQVVADATRKASAAEIVAAHDHYTLDLFRNLDGLVVWSGQHGTSNTPIPKVGSDWSEVTQPQEAFLRYASYIIRGINAFRAADPLNREEIWLHPDPRNYTKCRDLKWPPLHPMLAQFDFTKKEKHERYGDTREPSEFGIDATWEGGSLWVAKHKYVYSRLEICGVTPEHIDSEFSGSIDGRRHFGLFINEARAYVKKNRKDALRDWVLPLQPAFMHGTWSKESKAELGVDIVPADWADYYPLLRSVACTLTTPSSGSGWATTKPWQAFAVGTVCFFHPDYDTQGHIIPWPSTEVTDPELNWLGGWLRVRTPDELKERVKYLCQNPEVWSNIVAAQRRLYDRACADMDICRSIEARLDLTKDA